MQNFIEVIQESKTEYFTVTYTTGKKARMRLITNGAKIGVLQGNSKSAPVVNTALWQSIQPESAESALKRAASTCIALMYSEPSGRQLDKYFESGEYTERLVLEIARRAVKNKRLRDFLQSQYPTIYALVENQQTFSA